VREFEYPEFECALKAVFPHVQLWSQNHSELIAFVPATQSVGVLDAPADSSPEQAHFFLAACSRSPIFDTRAFGWLPSSGNVLRERERHIGLLNSELRQKEEWLNESQAARNELQRTHDEVVAELRRSNEWAKSLNVELKAAGVQLKTAGATIEELNRELAVRLEWVHDIEAQLDRARNEIARLNQENVERTEWAQSLDAELQITKSERERLEAQLRMIGESKWVRLGRTAGVGPVIDLSADPAADQ
jgi:septal ring factor EnvC (AmiA/AmiB activator)